MADRVPEWVNIAKSRALQKLHVKAYWLSGSGNVNATAELKTRPQEIRYLSFADPLHLNYAKLQSGLIEAFGISSHVRKLQLFWKGEGTYGSVFSLGVMGLDPVTGALYSF